MALKNFLVENSYTKINQFWFNKSPRLFEVSLLTTDQTGSFMTFYNVRCDGNANCIDIDGVVSADEQIEQLITSNFQESYLVSVPISSTYYSLNNMIISYPDKEITHKLASTVFNKVTNKYLENINNVWVTPDIPQCDKFFNEYFALDKHGNYTDIYNMGYFLTKLKKEFQGCLDA